MKTHVIDFFTQRHKMNLGRQSVNFKSYVQKRIDILLRTEQLERPLLKRYQDIDLNESFSKARMQQLAMRVIQQIGTTVTLRRAALECDFSLEMRKIYESLFTLILVSDLPLEFLFPEENEWNLNSLFDQAERDDEEYTAELHAWAIVEAITSAFSHLAENDHMLYYFLELAHYSFIQWAHKENITPEILLK